MKKRDVIISLHGIRTRGPWQKELAPVLAREGFIPYLLDYGHFSAMALMWKKKREEKIEWLRKEYDSIRKISGDDRPSIIAHSFGTYMVAALIEKYDVQFNTVIFCGSIVRADYDWAIRLESQQVSYVENDYGLLDRWPAIASRFIRGAGSAGKDGFSQKHRALFQRKYVKYRHSDYFCLTHYEKVWLPALITPRREVIEKLFAATKFVAERLKMEPNKVRANVLIKPVGVNYLKIMPGLHVNMTAVNGTDPRELEMSIPIDLEKIAYAGAGKAFNIKKPALAQYHGGLWRTSDEWTRVVSGVHPDLRWIIAVPLLKSNKAFGVMVVDGLESEVELSELDKLLEPNLVGIGQIISHLLKSVRGQYACD